MTAFEFATANRIIFGRGKLETLPDLCGAQTKRALLLHGRSSPALARVQAMLASRSIALEVYQVSGEPTLAMAREAAQIARGCHLVISLGGGSVMDTGKAAAALAANPGDILDYLEVVGRGQPLTQAPLPFFALPTTAGTGSEVTRNAVLESPAHAIKASLRSPLMLPQVALVDPALTDSLPPAVTAASGLDALTQLIEPFVSLKANPLTDAICREGLRAVCWALARAFQDSGDQSARDAMALASLFGGLALANAGLGTVHGFAGPLGGMCHAPHGAICARLLPLVMEANLKALQARQPEHPALGRYLEIARILTGSDQAETQDGLAWVVRLVNQLNIPGLSAHGLTTAQIPAVVQKTLNASSTKGNPIALSAGELDQILTQAL